jgi:RND superfamily putative drug exporter
MHINSSPLPSGGLARFVRAAARGASRRPKTVIALWLALIVACTALGSMAGTRSLSDSASDVGESAHAQATLKHAGLQDPSREAILVRSASPHATAATAASLAAAAAKLPQVRGVQAPATTPSLVADGGRTDLVVVTLRGSPDDASDHVAPLLSLAHHASHPGVTVQETGDASSEHAISALVDRGLQRAELISVPITLLILILAFGALVAASVPLLLGVTSVAAAIGALGLVSHLVPEGGSTAPVVVLIGLAVGIDYSLFAIRRERAERRAGRGPEAALDATAATVGRAIVVAGATVVIGLAGLLFSGFAVFTSMALGAIIVVAIAVLGSLTVLPAVLSLLGDRVDKGRIGRRRHAASRRGAIDPGRTVWGRIGAVVTGHPRTALAAALVVLAALAVPVLSMHTAADDSSALPKGTPVVIAADAVARAFPGASDTETLVVTGHALGRPGARAQLRRIGDEGRSVTGGHGPVELKVSRDGAVAGVGIPVPSTTHAQADANVALLRGALKPAVTHRLPGASAQLTGDDAVNVDFTHRLSTVTPLVIAFVLALAFVLLVATFGSPWLALSVMGLNLLSVGAAFGLLVAVFEHHWAQSLIGFTSTGAIVNWLPLFAFVVLFGLSMDYTVLVLERAAEARRGGLGAREAAAQALGATGSTVSSAALVMIAVFSIFATLPLLDFKQMGVGLAAAIALDATLVRGIALPAALALLGERGVRAGRAHPERDHAPQAAGWEHRVHGTRVEAGRG